MKYYVTVAGREYEVTVDGDLVSVSGVDSTAHLDPIPGTPLRHLLLGDRSHTLTVEAHGRGLWTLGYHGDRFDVEVMDERTRHIRGLTAGTRSRTGGAELRAPMPGLVVRVSVSPGQAVDAGTGVIVLEAMKMENELRAAAPATVKAVLVQPGQAVEKGQVLVEFAG